MPGLATWPSCSTSTCWATQLTLDRSATPHTLVISVMNLPCFVLVMADGDTEADSVAEVLGQAAGLPWSHDAVGRETGHPHPHHQLHEEVSRCPLPVIPSLGWGSCM